ncbi:MBL fold metallo-hydrolase [Sorangium sp. So ce1036]|uniref:MBL fold metallo-hydrolase n=1 Tax=Sorangium sp. So ce1036 TaxID=3133328 RepID=UPI003F0F41C0
MQIETFPTGPLGCNCSLLVDPVSKGAIVIDPGGDFDEIRARLERAGAQVAAIVHTHTHIDHVGATAPLQRWSGAAARIHEADRFLYDMLPIQAAFLGVATPETCEIDGDLNDGAIVKAGGLDLHVLHTPGHTPGSVSFLIESKAGAVAFTGDTLFRRGIGRTDLWGGDSQAIFSSIRRKLLTLDPSTRVVTGHGPSTTIGEERDRNPFLNA